MATHYPLLAACNECGMVSQVPDLLEGQEASCPRCNHTLINRVRDCPNKVFAYGTSVLIVLAISCFFPFMAISVKGISQHIALFDALSVFHYFDDTSLAALLMLTIIFLPVLYLLGLMALYAMAKSGSSCPGEQPAVKKLFRVVVRTEHWLMADIFFVGVLVSIIKLSSLTDIAVGSAFWAYLLFVLLLLKCSRTADRHWLCQHLFAPVSTGSVRPGDTHLDGNHLVCPLCSQINPTHDHAYERCQRCHARLPSFDPAHSSNVTLAVLIAAIIFYFPANLYPMMFTTSFADTIGSTIADGVILLWHMGSYPVALVIFTASIILPVSKMLILLYLLWSRRNLPRESARGALEKLKLYRFIEVIGRWSMIDVFVVAILSALVQFGNLTAITPGPAVFYFCSVVILTIISTRLFDPRILWQIDGQTRNYRH